MFMPLNHSGDSAAPVKVPLASSPTPRWHADADLKAKVETAAQAAVAGTGIDVIGNETLYRLCREHPDHTNLDAIGAKIWLIGRSYAAAIERRRKYRDELSDDFYAHRVIPGMGKSDIDEWLLRLRREDVMTEENIPLILKAHKHLLKKFEEITGLEKRSLASKYLHFHLPNLFFIYDARARSALTRIARPAKQFSAVINDHSVDAEYADFVYRALLCHKEVERMIGSAMSPREFDTMLILLENDVLRERLAGKKARQRRK